MNDKQRFSRYTEELRKVFPIWSKIRKDPNSIGAQFLSVIGWKLEEVEWLLNYAYDQVYIATADINQVDIIYKARIPNHLRPDMNYQFTSDSHVLHPASKLTQFLSSPSIPSHYGALQHDTQYYIDFEEKYVYVRQPFGASDEYPNGYLDLVVLDNTGREILRETLPLVLHHVWNFFDEFGLLLNVPRLYGERNAEYKERILDVFRRPSSSTYRGLMNGIARELGLVYQIKWVDGGTSIVLPHSRVDKESILVDNEPYLEEYIQQDESGRYVLVGMETYQGVERIVRYIAGVELHELHNEEDKRFQEELYHIDGTATLRLKYYVDVIRNRVPIMWGQWKWNQGFWNIADETMSGYGYLPSFYDARFTGWKTYTPKEG